MQKELKQGGVLVEMAALAHTNWAGQAANITNKADFPVLQDTAVVGAWDQMATPGKEYIWVFDKQGVVVSFFKPWELNLADAASYAKLKKVLVGLAK